MRRAVVPLLLAGVVAAAAATARSGEEPAPRRMVLVELFTSQG